MVVIFPCCLIVCLAQSLYVHIVHTYTGTDRDAQKQQRDRQECTKTAERHTERGRMNRNSRETHRKRKEHIEMAEEHKEHTEAAEDTEAEKHTVAAEKQT